MNRSIKDYALLYLKGVAMGAADVVPGVSGGTIAFISGIYEELIESIRSIPEAVKTLFTQGIKAAWTKANANFLIVLLAGIGSAVVTLAGLISTLIKEEPVPVWSFFFGLIVASTWFVGKSIKKIDFPAVMLFLGASALAYYITIASPSETPENYAFIFLSGVIAICAMILPGISGSFILLLLGKYLFIMGSLKSLDIPVILVFASGCLIGLLSFARVVSFMFKRFHNATLAVLTGFMLGSLNKVWPWKNVLEYRTNSHGEKVAFIEESVLPNTYADITGSDPQLLAAIGLAAFGFILVFAIEMIAKRKPASL